MTKYKMFDSTAPEITKVDNSSQIALARKLVKVQHRIMIDSHEILVLPCDQSGRHSGVIRTLSGRPRVSGRSLGELVEAAIELIKRATGL